MMAKGVIAALITPLNEDESVDTESLSNLVERVVLAGLKGIFIGGTIGEGLALRDRELHKLYRETVKHVDGRIPVLANISDVGTARSTERLATAMDAGVDIAVTCRRFAFPGRTPGETVRHVEALTAQSSIPIWYYENPSVSNVRNSFEAICGIMAIPGVRGLKFSSSDRQLFKQCVDEFASDRPVMTGNVSDIYYAARIGASGAVSGIAGLVPGLCASIFQEGIEGDGQRASTLQQSLESIYSIYGGTGWPLWPAAQKHVLKRMGVIKSSVVTAPFLRLGPEEERIIDKALDALDESLFSVRSDVPMTLACIPESGDAIPV